MEDIRNLDVFKPTFIAGVIRSFKADPAKFRGASFAPLRTTPQSDIVIDVKQYYDGLIPATALGAESPVVAKESRGQMKYKPAYFRGKKIMTENDIEQLRRLGTDNQLETRQEIVAEWLSDLDRYVELRIEQSRWYTLVNGKYSYFVDGQEIRINYNRPDKFSPVLTGTDKWSDLSGSDPIKDLQEWSKLFRGTPAQMGEIWINMNVLTLLLQNEKVRALIKNTFGSDRRDVTQTILTDIMKAHIPGFANIQVYDEGYNAHTFINVLASAGQKDVSVEDATYIDAGDIVTLKTADYTQQEDYIVDSKAGNVLTMTVNLASAFAVGDDAVAYKPFIPDDKVILKGRVPAGEFDMAFMSTPSAYNGGLLSPRPGKFGKSIAYDEDPPKLEIVSGIYGLPIMRNDTNIVATIK